MPAQLAELGQQHISWTIAQSGRGQGELYNNQEPMECVSSMALKEES